MGQPAAKVVRRLTRAHEKDRAVRLRLGGRRRPTWGYVLALTDSWVVVHVLTDGYFLDEVTLVRLQDVERVDKDPAPDFTRRVVDGLGVPVATLDAAPGATLGLLLRSLADRGRLVLLHQRVAPDYLHVEVGIILAVGKKHLKFHAVKGDGRWWPTWGRRQLARIERVSVGGRYLAALERFGDPPPAHDTGS
ncbi:hypothetical protein [Nocardioides zeae]|uniref:Uncharacterized protein n=1 Tax=Nocardioides zeae TaxID=1457234 RepID=A0A6P0HJS1_9ACTN|nr:hypothetical protein [Nocardioides zeae]NEN78969.1 hypothetical protein [Nocardioides zeae]